MITELENFLDGPKRYRRARLLKMRLNRFEEIYRPSLNEALCQQKYKKKMRVYNAIMTARKMMDAIISEEDKQ